MTDNEIIKVLECCTDTLYCPADCPLYEQPADCFLKLNKPILDLIKSQQAEIERLKAEADMADGYEDALCERVRTEAIKEFAERLKAKERPTFPLAMVIDVYEIDNLVKEMVGED